MKRLIRRLVFDDQLVKQYLTLGINDRAVQEKAFLYIADKVRIDVTNHQFVLCQKPFVIGIWSDRLKEPMPSQTEFNITDSKGNLLVVIKLKVLSYFDFNQGRLVLFQFTNVRCLFISWLHQKLIVSHFYLTSKNKISFRELDSFCAAYTFPRKVILACFGHSDNYNLFPMDLQGYIKDAGLYVLGLRNSNVSLQKILETRRVVVCDLNATDKDEILKLGNHHSSRPPDLETLPYNFRETTLFQVQIPDIARGYYEIEIADFKNMGTHTVMIGNIINRFENSKQSIGLYHLHIAYWMKIKNQYSIV